MDSRRPDQMPDVAAAYDSDPAREWNRLGSDAFHQLEYTVVLDRVHLHIPQGSRVLDAGGGPGRYAIDLARKGHDVVLLDVSPGCISLARERLSSEPAPVRNRLTGLLVGDVRDLSPLDSASFDAVLCLDPLTYIPREEEREVAVCELVRVARPGAMVLIGVRGYLAVLRTLMARFSDELLEESFDVLLRTGNTHIHGVMGHFFRADEIRSLAESCGLITVEMVACEGLASGMWDAVNALAEDERKLERWRQTVLATASEAAVVDLSEHILYVGRVPA